MLQKERISCGMIRGFDRGMIQGASTSVPFKALNPPKKIHTHV